MESKFKKISVVGLGYIGLPTAAVFSSHGIKVIGVDVNKETVDTINRGEIHIVEPGLEDVVKHSVNNGFLKAVTKPEPADAFLIAVPTPFKPEGHEPDLQYIEAASREIAKVLKKGDLIILESTSPVGATEQMAAWFAEERKDLTFPQHEGEASDIRIAHCPERVLPGKVLEELVSNDRVIGGLTPKCSEVSSQLYNIFLKGECITTNARTAEMCKLTENSFRDINIAFANELSIVCDKLNINVWELISLANRHPRVNILQPGPGVGGHCIAVDPWFIVSSSPKESRIIKTAREQNDFKPEWVITKVLGEIANHMYKKNINVAFYGVSFKPDIDDFRESPSLYIVNQVANKIENVNLIVVEPNARHIEGLADKAILTNLEEAFTADIHVFLVAHQQFKKLDKSIFAGNVLDFVGLFHE